MISSKGSRDRKVSSASITAAEKSGFQRRMSLPTISVNDKPVRHRKGSFQNAKPTSPIDPHRSTHVSEDLTSADSGTFSECMFRTTSKSSNKSSCSVYSIPSRPEWSDLEHLRKYPSNQSTSASHKSKRLHGQNLSKKHSARSYSSSLAPDRKRLVNQFLKSVDPISSSSVTKEHTPSTLTPFSGIDQESLDLGQKCSLQNVLYLDLERSQRNFAKPPPISMAGDPRSSSSSSACSSSALPEENSSSSSSLFGPSDEPYPPPGFEVSNGLYDLNNEIWHNYTELDYCKKHVATQLHNFENLIKQSLKDIVTKDEVEFQKNVKSFDSIVMDLKRMKQQVLQMYESIKTKSLASLRREFDENIKNTFISRINEAVEANVRQLTSLEDRIEVSKKKLVQQKDTLRKIESLLSTKDDILASRKNTKLAYQYRYMAFDIGIFTVVIFIFFLGRLLI